ncbi:MAG: hypothetical protein AABM64_17785 [Pseudomonadota bacterium]
MLKLWGLSVLILINAMADASAAGTKVWIPSEARVSLEACPDTGFTRITVEGLVREGIPPPDGTFSYFLIDNEDDEFAPIPLFVFSERPLETDDYARVRVTGQCSRRYSTGEISFPYIWVERYDIR